MRFPFLSTCSQPPVMYVTVCLWLRYDVLKPADDSKTAELERVEHSSETQKGETIWESASDR